MKNIILAISICALSATIVVKGAAADDNKKSQIEQLRAQVISLFDKQQSLFNQSLKEQAAGNYKQSARLGKQGNDMNPQIGELRIKLLHLESDE